MRRYCTRYIDVGKRTEATIQSQLQGPPVYGTIVLFVTYSESIKKTYEISAALLGQKGTGIFSTHLHGSSSIMASSVNTMEDHINYVISDFTLSTGVQLVVLILSGLSMAMAVGFSVWTFVNRKGRVVTASQPFFLYMICLGVFVLSLASAPLAIKESSNIDDFMHEIACNAKVWLYAIGYSVFLSALEAKLDRINRIMRSSSRCVRIKVTVCDTVTHMIALVGCKCFQLIPSWKDELMDRSAVVQLSTMCYLLEICFSHFTPSICSVNSFILILMMVISPIKYEPIDKIEFDGETIELRGTCIYGDSIGFLVALVVIFLLAMGGMAFQAYNARKLSTEYSESKFIFIILVTCDVIVILGAPVLYLAREHIFVNIRVYVESAMNFTL